MRISHLFWTAAVTFALVPLAAIARGQPDAKPRPAARAAAPDPNAPPPVQLPLTRVVLYNAGIAYFHREGDVTGSARLDLKFDEGDINDLLKSLVLTDKDGGKVRAVTYDNRVPVEFTLKGFAIDVTENPTMGQLLHQLRGEKVEVTDRAGVATVGRIVSVERPPVPPMGTDPGEMLNVLTEDGLQTVELKQLKKTKLLRPELQAEFVKALETLAGAKGDNKKAVSVVFSGNGKRKVAVGYVTEAPLWKPSYRLTVDEKGATRMQGWASIENTTDEDWVNVKVGLVAGRPMTFQMDMYDPLFVPRPTVEPDLFASLRPPMYQGGLNPLNPGIAMGGMAGMQAGNAIGFGGGQFGAQNLGVGGQNAGFGGLNQNQGAGGGFTSFGGGQLGQFGNLGGQFGFQGGLYGNVPAYLPRVPRPPLRDLYGERLSFAEYINRSRGNPPAPRDPEDDRPRPRPVRDPLDREAGALAAADGKLGDMFEYTIEEPISLARQKSAMLPLLNEPVEGARVSIYNASTLAKHPLTGLKLTNKTKLHLAQGPVAVYDGGTFAGDARLPDLKPGETRLVSYAIDLGTEVVEEATAEKVTLSGLTVAHGAVRAAFTHALTKKYLIRNRNALDRTVIVEHPIVAGRNLLTPAKPTDYTRDYYRFDVPAKPGELVTFVVSEEARHVDVLALAGSDRFTTDSLALYAKRPDTKPAVRDLLTRVIAMREKVADALRGIEAEQAALKAIADDQDRIRKNMEKAPKESDAFKRYLKKFDEQETQIEKHQAKVKELLAEKQQHEKALREFAETAKAE
jgi:hypothetical protein